MTTLAVFREILYRNAETVPDKDFGDKIRKQADDMTRGKHPYYTAEKKVPPEEIHQFGSLENHPQGAEYVADYWEEVGANKRWAEEYEEEKRNTSEQIETTH